MSLSGYVCVSANLSWGWELLDAAVELLLQLNHFTLCTQSLHEPATPLKWLAGLHNLSETSLRFLGDELSLFYTELRQGIAHIL